MAANVREFTDANFQDEVLAAKGPVLVDFWAPWCGPCKMLGPTIEELAGQYEGQVTVGKLNTDENPQVASSRGISSIPTVMLFKDGEEVDRLIGMSAKEKFVAMLDKHSAHVA